MTFFNILLASSTFYIIIKSYIITEGGSSMKLVKKIMTTAYRNCLSLIAALALIVTYSGVNSACWYVMNQDELPQNSSKLRKF